MILSYQPVSPHELISLVMATKMSENPIKQRGKDGLRKGKKEGRDEGNPLIRDALVSST